MSPSIFGVACLIFLKSRRVVCEVWNGRLCGEGMRGKQKKGGWIGGLSTKSTLFAQPVCGAVWKRWERKGGWDEMEGRFPFVRKGTGEI